MLPRFRRGVLRAGLDSKIEGLSGGSRKSAVDLMRFAIAGCVTPQAALAASGT